MRVALKTRLACTPSEVAPAAVLLLTTRAPSLIIRNYCFPADHFHGVGKRTVSDSNWGCDAAHTDGHSHRRTADSGVCQLVKLGLNCFDVSQSSQTFLSFQAKFTITKCEDEKSSNVTFIIECEGAGVTNPHL